MYNACQIQVPLNPPCWLVESLCFEAALGCPRMLRHEIGWFVMIFPVEMTRISCMYIYIYLYYIYIPIYLELLHNYLYVYIYNYI